MSEKLEDIKLKSLIHDNKYGSTNQILTGITPCWGFKYPQFVYPSMHGEESVRHLNTIM